MFLDIHPHRDPGTIVCSMGFDGGPTGNDAGDVKMHLYSCGTQVSMITQVFLGLVKFVTF